MDYCFANQAAEFIYVRSYSHWLDDKKRRETWPETVKRYVDFLRKHRGSTVPEYLFQEIEGAILRFEIMPSMRAMWSAGAAAEKDNLTMYNCAFAKIDSIDSFAECLYILMCGAGFGFDVSREAVEHLPLIPPVISTTSNIHLVDDSREGWADSVKFLMKALYSGENLLFDYSSVRPKGMRLKTMGGRASGPEPLMALHDFIREVFVGAQGRRLKPIECHDICNKIAEIVVVGGVRRSSEISLSNLNDTDMRDAKVWPFPAHRAMANNSVIYTSKPSWEQFQVEWKALEQSGTGERGIFNLHAAKANAPVRRNAELIAGTNPCGEILLRSMQFCNLSEVVVRDTDDIDTLLRKVRLATIVGAIQSTFTYFPYLRPDWARNCEEERLLGVSLTGIMDAPSILTKETLSMLKNIAKATSRDMAEMLHINAPVAVTCIKPSGTVSQLTNSASGMHPRYAKFYIRRFRISGMDPLYKMMRDQGFTFIPEVGQEDDPQTWVVQFPIAAPDRAVTREAVSAIDQLELYKLLQESWSEHNSSLTVYIRSHQEWKAVGEWVWDNWNTIKGVSFLPYSDFYYKLAPYEEITAQQYEQLCLGQHTVDYKCLSYYEMEDTTEGAKTFACVGDRCELK